MKYIIAFFILFLNWVIWSGMFDAFHLSLGVISCLLVIYMSHDILFTREKFTSKHLIEVIRFIKYIPWLLYQIVLSNIYVARLVMNPNMPIDPQLIRFKTKLKKNISVVTFANSITITPGTITADIREGEFCVHCISKKVADDLLTGEMENKVAYIFMED
ncbi:MAG: Na+/H+ antiporter subunit E [Deltaproteobacteria bacterium]